MTIEFHILLYKSEGRKGNGRRKENCMYGNFIQKGTIAVSHAGVRSDWMEQDGPADCVREKIFAVGWKIRPGAVFAYRKTTERYGHYLISGL